MHLLLISMTFSHILTYLLTPSRLSKSHRFKKRVERYINAVNFPDQQRFWAVVYELTAGPRYAVYIFQFPNVIIEL